MEVTKELILRFLENKCSATEAEKVVEQLRINPSLLDEHLNQKEWEIFNSGTVPEAVSNSWFEQIQVAKEPVVIKRYSKRWLSAAAAIVVIATGITLQHRSRHTKGMPGVVAPGVTVAGQKDTVVSNEGSNIMPVMMEDGSQVVLSANSVLRYKRPLDVNKRWVYLTGEALFYVAKDSSRPFTVFTKGFSTTALGTAFKITDYANRRVAKVMLISGRVVVKSRSNAARTVYMKAGEQCTFSNKLNEFMFKPAAVKNRTDIDAELNNESIKETDREVLFYNTPLPDVFYTLSNIYSVPIEMNNLDLQNRKFTGKCSKNSTLNEAAEVIIKLNDLTVKKVNNTFYISRK